MLSGNLRQGDDGVWYPVERHESAVHYPDEGNALCYQLEEQSFWFRHRNDCILSAVGRFPPPGAIYDIGGGNGFVSLALQQSGCSVVLVEPGQEGIANARRRGVETLICASLEEAGFDFASLPAAGLFDVLEHIDDDRAFLSMIASLLVPGGRMYLTTPAYRLLWSHEDDLAGHRRRYTLRSLRRLFADCGLRVDFATYFFFPLPIPIFCARVLAGKKQGQLDPESELRAHQAPAGLSGKILNSMLARELARLEKGRALAFGSSCLVVGSASQR